MANYNKVTLIGNLTKDPEVKMSKSGTSILNGSIAINRVYKVKKRDGVETHERVSFFEFCLFGQRADTFAKYTGKGSQVLLEGRLEQERWEGEDGKGRSKVVVYVDEFQFLSRKEEETTGSKKKRQAPIGPPHRKTNPPEENPIDWNDEVPF